MPVALFISIAILLTAFAIAAPRYARRAGAQTSPCSGQRLAVATLSDPAAAVVDPNPLELQVVDLANWPSPSALGESPRIGGVETHTYAITAELLRATPRDDGGLNLVLAQPGDERWTLVAIMLNPAACPAAAASQRSPAMSNSLSSFAATLGASGGSSPQSPPPIVKLTGVAFYSPNPPIPGDAANGLELSPVLSFTLAGPAALRSFPVLPPATLTASTAVTPTTAQSTPPAALAAIFPTVSSTPSPLAASTSTTTGAVPPSSAQATATRQQISDALATNPPSGGELPAGFSSSMLASAGPASDSGTSEYDLNFLAVDATGQPAALLRYAVFDSAGEAQSFFAVSQNQLQQSNAQILPQTGESLSTICAQLPGSNGAVCAAITGNVAISAQAADQGTALALVRAGVAHLLRLVAVG
jgi:hypothetical protein